ncbi:MAG: glycosyltransferase [Chloroflexi bacterium]|nr:glycosyltransferase [Chloroflexota bacterium]
MTTDYPPKRFILDVPVHDLTYAETVELFRSFIAEGRFHHVVTINPEFVIASRRQPAFRRVLRQADLALPDGAFLLLAGRMLGQPLRQRVTGVDTVAYIAQEAARYGWRLFFLGAAPGVASRAAQILTQRYPGLQVVGTYAGSPRPTDAADILSLIRQAAPHILFVAYGAPAQDVWIEAHRPDLPVQVAMGVGGAFDFIAGVTYRAPRWMQDAGLEWLHRLYQQPWRWRRMTALPLFAILVVLRRLSGNKNSHT